MHLGNLFAFAIVFHWSIVIMQNGVTATLLKPSNELVKLKQRNYDKISNDKAFESVVRIDIKDSASGKWNFLCNGVFYDSKSDHPDLHATEQQPEINMDNDDNFFFHTNALFPIPRPLTPMPSNESEESNSKTLEEEQTKNQSSKQLKNQSKIKMNESSEIQLKSKLNVQLKDKSKNALRKESKDQLFEDSKGLRNDSGKQTKGKESQATLRGEKPKTQSNNQQRDNSGTQLRKESRDKVKGESSIRFSGESKRLSRIDSRNQLRDRSRKPSTKNSRNNFRDRQSKNQLEKQSRPPLEGKPDRQVRDSPNYKSREESERKLKGNNMKQLKDKESLKELKNQSNLKIKNERINQNETNFKYGNSSGKEADSNEQYTLEQGSKTDNITLKSKHRANDSKYNSSDPSDENVRANVFTKRVLTSTECFKQFSEDHKEMNKLMWRLRVVYSSLDESLNVEPHYYDVYGITKINQQKWESTQNTTTQDEEEGLAIIFVLAASTFTLPSPPLGELSSILYEDCFVAGWGYNSASQTEEHLKGFKVVKTTFFSRNACKWELYSRVNLSESTVCSFIENDYGDAITQDDVGAPLFCREYNGLIYIVGILDRLIFIGNGERRKIFGLYQRVSDYAKEISMY